MENIVSVRGLSKHYRVTGKSRGPFRRSRDRLIAVDNVDLEIVRGEVVGLLGPNGAGKTTLIKMICGLLRPDRGTGTVLGHDILAEPERIRSHVSLVAPTADIGTDNNLTVRENLEFWAAVYGISRASRKKRIDDLLDLVHLADRQDVWPMRISAGMRQRLAIARSLLAKNDLLLLDEPTIKLDPDGARDIRSFVREVNQRNGVTVLLTTHQMFEAEDLCHRILVMHRGSIVADGSPAEIKRAAGHAATIDLTLSKLSEAMVTSVRNCTAVESVSVDLSRLRLTITTTNIEQTTQKLFEITSRAGARVLSMKSTEPSLEDAFQHFTNTELGSQFESEEVSGEA